MTIRADSAFYSKDMLATAAKFDVRFSITARQDKRVRAVIDALPDQAWQPIPYWLSAPEVSGADIAETPFTVLASDERQRPPGPSGRPSGPPDPHLPSGKFMANAAWLALAVMAHNLGRAVGQLARPDLRRFDWPDQVHLRSMARTELKSEPLLPPGRVVVD